ncbi:MAG: hypothetical protein P9L99_10965 [Candidatus Lernaella stagnicola]|nr:hypothetical protein [Candidatus Lernaella stagnicola]
MVRRVLFFVMALALAACGSTPGRSDFSISSKFDPFVWTMQVDNVRPGFDIRPTDTWSFDYNLTVDFSAYDERFGRFTELIVAAYGELRFDQEGNYRAGSSSYAVASNLATTGLPIERFEGWPLLRLVHGKDGSPFEAVQTFELDGRPRGRHTVAGTLAVDLPRDAPLGYYEPTVLVFVRVEGVADPVQLKMFGNDWNEEVGSVLPLVKVGEAATPRLPWTIFGQAQQMGRSGALPEQDRDHVALVGRVGFTTDLILRPDHYELSPGFPTIFPHDSIAPLDGGGAVVPDRLPHYFDMRRGEVTVTVNGPAGFAELGTRRMVGEDKSGPRLEGEAFSVDLRQTGRYEIEMSGYLLDRQGRRFEGGGKYIVFSALPLTFSTSCKPGTSFLVGGAYPAKVNLNPPAPAEVEVEIEYYPNSEVDRRRVWSARGQASRFGHFVPHGQENLVFDEPGEYRSVVRAQMRDPRGRLWMGQQVSAGVIAPLEPVLHLHGTRSFPYGHRINQPYFGAQKRFRDRQDLTTSFFPNYTPSMLPDSYAPYDGRDTLFIPSNGFNESLVEPHLSMSLSDADYAAWLQDAAAFRSFAVPPSHQPAAGPWQYLGKVVKVSSDSFSWFPADAAHRDELPIVPVGNGRWNPYAYQDSAVVQAYTYLGVIRPGFPVMTSVHQTDAIGLYWLASPNRFGFHYNTSRNGDLPGDMCRIQAGAVLLDRRTGRNLYDAYAAAIVVAPSKGAATSISPPGERPLAQINGREQFVFLGIDTHDAMEVGETIALGGMVFPAVEADVTWMVTKPSGEKVKVFTRTNRLGLGRGKPLIPADEPGIYRVDVDVRYGELRGDVVGTSRGSYWHCAVPRENLPLISTSLPPSLKIDPAAGLRVPLSWPSHLREVKLHFGVMMPGQVLDEGVVETASGGWEYSFEPLQWAVQFPNFDVRNFGSGELEMADTVVMQFFLEAIDGGEPVYDSLRLVVRGNTFYNYEAMAEGRPGGSHP